jgi:hypothetical protein
MRWFFARALDNAGMRAFGELGSAICVKLLWDRWMGEVQGGMRFGMRASGIWDGDAR